MCYTALQCRAAKLVAPVRCRLLPCVFFSSMKDRFGSTTESAESRTRISWEITKTTHKQSVALGVELYQVLADEKPYTHQTVDLLVPRALSKRALERTRDVALKKLVRICPTPPRLTTTHVPTLSFSPGPLHLTSSTRDKVHVEGMKVTPLKDFASAGMPAEVMKYVTIRGWKEPTLIQSHCWPVLNAGRDVIGIAETGSGKTLGFSLPAMSKIFDKLKVLMMVIMMMMMLAVVAGRDGRCEGEKYRGVDKS